MSGERPLLDSVILIDHFNGVQEATDYLRTVYGQARISAVTRAEVLCVFDEVSLPAAAALLDRFVMIPIDAPIADLAARLRRQHGWKLPDALQAGAALHHGLVLATRNTRDFAPGHHAFVRVPYRL